MRVALDLLPEIQDQHAFNGTRWNAILSDSRLASLDFRIETDRFGNLIMTPPHGLEHSLRQGSLIELFRNQFPSGGQALPECPVSTSAGVKAVDVAWVSDERLEKGSDGNFLVVAPEICVEVLSQSNRREEIAEKKRLYFEEHADEVWICGLDGKLSFYRADDPENPMGKSRLCPNFPSSL